MAPRLFSRGRGSARIPCYACAELVHPDARKCRWCGEWYGELAQRSPADAASVTASTVANAIERGPGRTRVIVSNSAEPIARDVKQADLRIDPIALEVGTDLLSIVDPDRGRGELLESLKRVRRNVAREYGVIAPGVRARFNPDLPPASYQIRITGDLVAEGEVLVTHQLGVGQDLDVPGINVVHTTDPIYGTPAVWIRDEDASLGEQHGLQMFSPTDVVSTHVGEVVKQHLAELLTREEVAELLNMARQDAPMVVQELVPNMLALGQIRQVLQNLVREQVPIKDLSTILNALADNAVYTKDPHALTEHVRGALGRKLCARYQSPDGTLKAFMLSPDAERAIQNGIQLNETGQVLMLDPNTSRAIQDNLADALAKHKGTLLDPIVVCPPKIRRHVKALLERNFPKIVVLSYSEIVEGVQIDNLEMIGCGPESGGPLPARPPSPSIATSDWLMSDAEDEPSEEANEAMDWSP